MEKDLDKIFLLKEEDDDQVIIRVINNDSPLTIARYPFINSNMAYITVTRGEDHILTVINKDGKTYSFHWGNGGYTLISEELERLKKAVVQFIQDDEHILLEWRKNLPIEEATIYYNNNFRKWQLTLECRRNGKRNTAHWWSNEATNWEDMATEVIPYVHACGWEKDVAVTGIDVWRAIL